MSKETTITLDLANLDRNQTFALINIISEDAEHYDANTDALVAHAAAHVFDWVKQAERENDFDQIDFYETVLLPDDYNAPGIWYDQIGWRYDHNDYSVTTTKGTVFFNEARWLDDDNERWDLVEEAAQIFSKDGATDEVDAIATALAVMTRRLAPKAEQRPDKDFWTEYIKGFAQYNYKNGERVEE